MVRLRPERSLAKAISGHQSIRIAIAAYHWVDAHRRQLCWAHLKREFLAINERGGVSAEIGEGLLEQVKDDL